MAKELTVAGVLCIALASLAREGSGADSEAVPPIRFEDPVEWRRNALARWRKLLGLESEPGPPPLERLVREESAGDHLRRWLELELEPGDWTPACLLIPSALGGAPGKRGPGILVLHSTSDRGVEEVVGSRPTEKHRALGLDLVRRGHVVLAPRNFIWGYRGRTWKDACAELERARPGLLGMGKMLSDAMRATDYLASLPEVDRDRLGAAGFSLGGKEALYCAAFDARIRAAVSMEGGVGISFSNWDAVWYLGDKARGLPAGMGHHEIVALACPRALLVVGGESADGERTRPLIEAARPLYAAWGVPGRLDFLNHRKGHDLPPEAIASTAAWFEKHLRADLGAGRDAGPGFLRPDEEDALVKRWEQTHGDLVEVHSVAQHGGRRAWLVAVGAAEGRRERPAALFAVPHAHEPAGSAAILDVVEALLEGKGLDGRPLPLDREKVLHAVTLCFIADGNPAGRARAPVRAWDGLEFDNRGFLDIAFGLDAGTFARSPREASWKLSERKPARIGIVYEAISDDEHVEPNRDRRSSYFRLADLARSRFRVVRWLDLHQTEFEGSRVAAQVLLPILQAELPGAIRAENEAWARQVTDAWETSNLGRIRAPAALGYGGKQRELLVASMGAIEKEIPKLATEVRNNHPGTPPERQRELQRTAIVETIRRMLAVPEPARRPAR